MAQETLVYDFVNKPSLEAVKGPTLSITRATTGTVMGSNGYLTQVASGEARFTGARRRENLTKYSETFKQGASDWIYQGIGTSPAAGPLTPQGLSSKYLVPSTGLSQHRIAADGFFTGRKGKTYCVSFMVKQADAGLPRAAITVYTGTYYDATWDISTGTAVNDSGNLDTKGIIDLGDGWYRIYLIVTLDADTTPAAQVSGALWPHGSTTSGATTSNPNGTDGIYATGAMIEGVPSGTTTPSEYIPTTTAAVSKVDYAPNIASHVSRDGLLVEEARTNICLQSEDFSTTWTIDRASVSANAAVAPDGSLTADELIEDATASNTHRAYQNVTGTAASYTFSVFMKANTRTWAYLRFTDSGSLPRHAWFDLGNGAVGTTEAGVTASIEDYGNGWYRCIATIGTSQTGATPILIGIATADNVSSYNGDGASSIYIWGAHDELGAFPTSYIPTTTASVTRNADAVSTTDVGWFNQPAGTILGKWSVTNINSTSATQSWSIHDGSTNNRMFSQKNTGPTAGAVFFGVASAAVQWNLVDAATFTANAEKVVVGAYLNNDIAMYTDGVAATPDTSATLPTGLTTLNVGGSVGGAAALNGHIAEIAYWPERLSDSELSELSNGTTPITVGNGMNTMTAGQWWLRRRKLKRRSRGM